MKENSEYLEYMWPMRHFLITCGDIKGAKNIVTLSYCMPVSKAPPLLGIALRKDTYSYELIRNTKEFILNTPPKELKSKVYYCGFHSGRNVDKFSQTGLSPAPAKSVMAPIIEECLAHMECRLVQEVPTGDKILLIGEVIEAYGNKELTRNFTILDYALGEFPKKIYGDRFK